MPSLESLVSRFSPILGKRETKGKRNWKQAGNETAFTIGNMETKRKRETVKTWKRRPQKMGLSFP